MSPKGSKRLTKFHWGGQAHLKLSGSLKLNFFKRKNKPHVVGLTEDQKNSLRLVHPIGVQKKSMSKLTL